jgi:hypothetical protein
MKFDLQPETLRVYAGLGVVKITLIMMAIAVFMAGCASDVPPAKLNPPPGYLMTPPKAFPPIKEGDDAAQKLAEAAEAHNRNARKIRGLQGYIKTSRKE